MYLKQETLDDVLRVAFENILEDGVLVKNTRGDHRECLGVLLEIENPRARLSRTESRGNLFSCVGELLWYLTKDNSLDFITYYIKKYTKESEDGKTIYGAYGPRIFNNDGVDQFQNVVNLLRERGSSRRAIIQISSPLDIDVVCRREIPCTCTLQYIQRNGKLHALTSMRSNDAYVGLPHDVFAFTMLQEIIASILGLGLGSYRHFVGSLHVYEEKVGHVNRFLSEGFQSTKQVMPAMPPLNDLGQLHKLVQDESLIRSGRFDVSDICSVEPYWRDFYVLLLIYNRIKNKRYGDVGVLADEIDSPILKSYIYKYLDKVNF